MSLWGRLALAMVFLVVATICALSLFNSGSFAVGRRPVLAGAVVAVLLALVLAAAIARSWSRPLIQMTRAVQGLSRGQVLAMPRDGGREIALLAAALAEMPAQLGTK